MGQALTRTTTTTMQRARRRHDVGETSATTLGGDAAFPHRADADGSSVGKPSPSARSVKKASTLAPPSSEALSLKPNTWTRLEPGAQFRVGPITLMVLGISSASRVKADYVVARRGKPGTRLASLTTAQTGVHLIVTRRQRGTEWPGPREFVVALAAGESRRVFSVGGPASSCDVELCGLVDAVDVHARAELLVEEERGVGVRLVEVPSASASLGLGFSGSRSGPGSTSRPPRGPPPPPDAW